MTHPADRIAYDKSMVAEPVWNRIESAREAIALPENVLLHAGPPFQRISDVPKPVMNSACVAAVFEGLARDFDAAECGIRSGEIELEPAQDRGVVVPLAAVASASMPLHAVYDAHGGRVRAFAPINGGSGPSLRLGLRSEAVLEHIRWLNDQFSEVLELGIAEGIELVPIAAESLRRGDDCHGRTACATELLADELRERTTGGIRDERAVRFMNSSPSLFLNLWMAAVKCAFRAAENVKDSAMVTAAGGNGIDAGIQVSSLPCRWILAPASPPRGDLDSSLPNSRVLGAVGDSAVIDAYGLGAMAFNVATRTADLFKNHLPSDACSRRERLMIGPHLAFGDLDLQFGVSARQAAEFGSGPFVSLGALDAEGECGRLGGGIYEMPVALFRDAMNEIRIQQQ